MLGGAMSEDIWIYFLSTKSDRGSFKPCPQELAGSCKFELEKDEDPLGRAWMLLLRWETTLLGSTGLGDATKEERVG